MSVQEQLQEKVERQIEERVRGDVEDKIWYGSGGQVLLPVGVRVFGRVRGTVLRGINR